MTLVLEFYYHQIPNEFRVGATVGKSLILYLGCLVRRVLERDLTSIGREIILRSDDSHLYKRAQDFIAF